MPAERLPSGRTRVVIADDDRLYAEVLRTALSANDDFDVVGIATDGGGAVDLAKRLRPDLVLMDWKMPRVDGIEATRQLRELEEPPAVVMLSGTDSSSELEATKAGAAAFLRKARDLADLIDVIAVLGTTVSGPPPANRARSKTGQSETSERPAC